MKISVALCTYNGVDYIAEQLASILNQTYKVDQIVVSDDGSTDETLGLVLAYKKMPNGTGIRIDVFQNEYNSGTIKNFENAIAKCDGDIIFLADQDDIWLPNKVKTVIDFFEKNAEQEVVFTNGYIIDFMGIEQEMTLWEKFKFTKEKQLQWIDNNLVFWDILHNVNFATGATMAFKKSIKNKLMPFPLFPSFFYHDAYVAMIAAAYGKLSFIEEPLIKYRVHDKQQVGFLKIFRKEGDNLLWTEFQKEIHTKYRAKIRYIKWSLRVKNFFKKNVR